MPLSRDKILHSLQLRSELMIKYSAKECNQAYIITITIIFTDPLQ